jgi:dihydrofolate reductase
MKAIVAVDRNWGIGCQGKLLALIPEDMKYFKGKTLGKVVVMGRETFESLPGKKPLPGRTNIVLTGNPDYVAACSTCISMDAALEQLRGYADEEIYIIGGEQIYRQFLPYCDEVYVTRIDDSFPCDKYFPNLNHQYDWQLTEAGPIKEHNGLRYQFTKYSKGMEKWIK